jgi:hypothetical protein
MLPTGGKRIEPVLGILWVHRPGSKVSYLRVAETGNDLFTLLKELGPVFEAEGIRVEVREKVLSDPVDTEELYFNGMHVEELIMKAAESQGWCSARRCEPGIEGYAKWGERNGLRTFETTELLIRKAILLALGF